MRLILLLVFVIFVHSARVTSLGHLQPEAKKYELSAFYCGFGQDFCGQSTDNDVAKGATFVILAFVNTKTDGSVDLDQSNFPSASFKKWKSQGKKVLISVGGQNGNWAFIFASQQNINNFVASVKHIIEKWELDGVDIDIESYLMTPRVVANMILDMRKAIGSEKMIVVSPECVTVYQGVPDYGPDTPGQAFNYFVNIIRLADDAIDLYQPQAYNNWYDFPGGTLNYLKDVYLNWRNYKGMMDWMKPLENFKGVAGNKLMMGVLASTSAGGAAYYYQPTVIAQFKAWLVENKYELRGFMMWDSHWDALNQNAISNEVTSK